MIIGSTKTADYFNPKDDEVIDLSSNDSAQGSKKLLVPK